MSCLSSSSRRLLYACVRRHLPLCRLLRSSIWDTQRTKESLYKIRKTTKLTSTFLGCDMQLLLQVPQLQHIAPLLFSLSELTIPLLKYTGSLRFRAAQAPAFTPGVQPASAQPASCLQAPAGLAPMTPFRSAVVPRATDSLAPSEDCLFLKYVYLRFRSLHT